MTCVENTRSDSNFRKWLSKIGHQLFHLTRSPRPSNVQEPPRTSKNHIFVLQASPHRIQIQPFAERPPRSISGFSMSYIGWFSDFTLRFNNIVQIVHATFDDQEKKVHVHSIRLWRGKFMYMMIIPIYIDIIIVLYSISISTNTSYSQNLVCGLAFETSLIFGNWAGDWKTIIHSSQSDKRCFCLILLISHPLFYCAGCSMPLWRQSIAFTICLRDKQMTKSCFEQVVPGDVHRCGDCLFMLLFALHAK